MFPHHKAESETHGGSPGNGMTPMPMSRNPIATEGEATPGPDDVNPYDELEYERFKERMKTERRRDRRESPKMRLMGGGQGGMDPNPTNGDDPYFFDDVADDLEEVETDGFGLPGLDRLGLR
jgi:hypothetical protein